MMPCGNYIPLFVYALFPLALFMLWLAATFYRKGVRDGREYR